MKTPLSSSSKRAVLLSSPSSTYSYRCIVLTSIALTVVFGTLSLFIQNDPHPSSNHSSYLPGKITFVSKRSLPPKNILEIPFIETSTALIAHSPRSHSLPTPQTIPSIGTQPCVQDTALKNFSGRSDYNGSIFLSYYLPSAYFQYINYKSLESLLTTYPQASVKIIIIAPETANYYKVGDIISKTTFLKYRKQGFQVTSIIQDTNYMKETYRSLPGSVYFGEQIAFCCGRNVNRISLHQASPPPFHFIIYNLLANVYLEGGAFSDFNWLHLSPLIDSILAEGSQGFTSYKNCTNQTNTGHSCIVSFMGVFRAKHPVIECMLHKYEDHQFQSCIKGDKVTHGVDCVDRAMMDCFHNHSAVNRLNSINFNNFNWIYQRSLNNCRNHDHGAIQWLGSKAFSSDWIMPVEGSFLFNKIIENNHYLHDQYIQRIQKKIRQVHFITQNLTRCSKYYSYREYALDLQRKASASCALSFTIPGFMKAGTTYLYDTITNHPLMVKALQGVGFKETGCYDTPGVELRKAYQRLQCFPFVEPHDFVVFADATVHYATRPHIARNLYLDNPNLRVIFSIRNPIARLQSYHRFDYFAYRRYGIGDINECISLSLHSNESSLYSWHQAAQETLKYPRQSSLRLQKIQRLIDFYKVGIAKGHSNIYHRCAKLIYDSLYFPAIFQWYKVIPKHNIRVLNTERFQLEKMSDDEKINALKRSPVIEDYNLTGFLIENSGNLVKEGINISHSHLVIKKKIDRSYILYQFNAIFR